MATSAWFACSGSETSFGPAVGADCLGGFDFTLLFEDSILTILPLGIAGNVKILARILSIIQLDLADDGPVSSALVRITVLSPLDKTQPGSGWSSFDSQIGTLDDTDSRLKGTYATYAGLQVALLPISLALATETSRSSIPSVALAIGTFVLLTWVSYLEHTRSLRPSTLLIVYLSLSTLLDLARVRTVFLLGISTAVAALLLTSLLLKVIALILELIEKRSLVFPDHADPSPEATGSIADKSLFIWINRLLWEGSRNTLELEDLMPLDAELTAASDPIELSRRWTSTHEFRKDTLLLNFLIHYKWTILAGVLPRLCTTGFRFAQPFLVQRVLSFLDDTAGSSSNSNDVGYGLVGAYALVYIGLALSSALYEYYTNRVMAQFRGSLVSMICHKSFRASQSSAIDAEAMTLMSADVDRIALSSHILHESYGSLIELGIALYLIYRLLGVAMAAAAVWLAISLGLGIPLATVAGNAQMPWLEAIEQRLAVTARAIEQIIPIRMSGFSGLFSSKISELRNSEIRASRRYRLMAAFMTSASFLASSFTPVVGLGTFAILANANNNGTLTEDVAFAALTLFDLLQQPVSYVLNVFEDFQIARNSFSRIQDYLLCEEQHDYRRLISSQQSIDASNQDYLPEKDIEKTDIAEKKDELSGSKVAFRASDAAGGYVKGADPVVKNLSFQIPLARSTAVIGPVGCGKSTLLRLLVGELPVVTGLISAVLKHVSYCPQTPWIMRGTIRSNIVGSTEWDEAWYNKVIETCALRHDFDDLEKGDLSPAGARGSRLSGGQKARISLARAIYSQNEVVLLDSVLNGLDAFTEKSVIEAVFGKQGLLRATGKTVVFATNSASHLSFADHVVELDANGTIRYTGDVASLTPNVNTNLAEVVVDKDNQISQGSAHSDEDFPDDFVEDRSQSRRTSDSKVYLYYIRTVGIPLMVVYLLTCSVYIVSSIFPSIWVQMWTNSNAEYSNNRLGYWLGVYAAIALATIVTSVLSEMLFMLVIIPKTSRRFHSDLLSTTFKATAAFLTLTDTGTTINRFSQDLELSDNDLPQAFDLFILEAMSTISSVVLIFIGSSYIAATVPLCIAVLWMIQKFYLRTSRQLRLLDIEAKTPLFSQFLETLDGVSSIRAYNWTDQFLQRQIEALDQSQKPYYLMVCIQKWLTLVLDLFVAGLAILLVGLATGVRGGASDYLGVALLNIVNFSSTLQSLVTQWTQLETAIGAVSRIRSYVAETPPEDRDDQTRPVSADWPSEGGIYIDHLFASYSTSDEQLALKDVCLDIKPGEKVAICGRTGSGKSSLLAAILHLLHIKSGDIRIDGASICDVSREVLRERLNTLPQEGVLLEGTVRDNLNVSGEISDDRMTDALSKVRLWKVFSEQSGLDTEVTGDTLSHGQRQLFCIARAMLKPGRIILMDESTSSIDAELDDVVDDILQEDFGDRTVISVVHKLGSVLNFDRVAVVDRGRVVEYDKPQLLLEKKSSYFRDLYLSMASNQPLQTTGEDYESEKTRYE